MRNIVAHSAQFFCIVKGQKRTRTPSLYFRSTGDPNSSITKV